MVSIFVWFFIRPSCSYYKLHAPCLITFFGRAGMVSEEKERHVHPMSARLEVGRWRDQRWMSIQTGLNEEVRRKGQIRQRPEGSGKKEG